MKLEYGNLRVQVPCSLFSTNDRNFPLGKKSLKIERSYLFSPCDFGRIRVDETDDWEGPMVTAQDRRRAGAQVTEA